MTDELKLGVIAWWNEDQQKGMMLDAECAAYVFNFLNLDDQLRETGCHESHIVAAEIRWRNGIGLARMLHCPTIEEAAEHGDVLRDVYERNKIEQALRKAERRSSGFYSSLR